MITISIRKKKPLHSGLYDFLREMFCFFSSGHNRLTNKISKNVLFLSVLVTTDSQTRYLQVTK